MIVDNGKYYLYRHIRLDKNEPFYIGIGTKRKKDSYARAKTFHRENSIWKRIIAKTKYKTEILLESNNYSFIKNKEEEFIKLYGRKNLNTGTLANLTNGGEGNTGIICSNELRQIRSINQKKRWNEGKIKPRSKESIEKQRQKLLGRKTSEETKQKQREAHIRRKLLGLKKPDRKKESNKKQSNTMKALYKERGIPENSKKTLFKKGRPSANNKSLEVLDLETGIYYNSITEAANSKELNRRTLNKRLRDKIKNNTSLILLNNEL